MPHLSIVTPVYGCQLALVMLYERLCEALAALTEDFEIIMVDDRSPDDAWSIIGQLARRDSRVRGVQLARNFGQHPAITAGIDLARGDWVVVMDCDLQDRPEEIPHLYAKAQEGFDVVVGLRVNRQDRWLTRASSRLFYVLFNYLTDQKLDSHIANFGIYSAQAIAAIRRFREKDRSFGLLALLVGFRRAEIAVQHGKRPVGRSSYNFRKRLDLAIDHILSHSARPLKLMIKFGFLIALCSFTYGGWQIIRHLGGDQSVLGWTSVIVSILFATGLLVTVIGIVGLYVGKIYDEVKARPLYLIAATTFVEDA